MSSNPKFGRPGKLLDELREIVGATGPIPVARYMDLCLTHPEYGYYRQRDAIGAGGDFVTAPEISQIFGELIGIWVATTWQQLGEPSELRLVELGPGRGTMMRDILRTLRVVPGLRERVRPTLVEISSVLREKQRSTLEHDADGLTWCGHLDGLSKEPSGVPTIILANEFFDALPVTQFIQVQGEWHERAVTTTEQGLLMLTHLPEVVIGHATAADGDIRETRTPVLRAGEPSLIDTLAAMSQAAPTVLLAIDYGYQGPETGDTLQAMKAQAYADVLANPGEQDITAHVDFTELATVLSDAGLAPDGPIAQSEFLSGLGFAARLNRLLAGKTAQQINDIETAAHRLVAEPGMGSLFRVLAARSPTIAPLIPFPSAVERPRK